LRFLLPVNAGTAALYIFSSFLSISFSTIDIVTRLVTVDGVFDRQLDLLDHNQSHNSVTVYYTLQHNTRLATAPKPAFHCNQLC
jgi:hypothetical protein